MTQLAKIINGWQILPSCKQSIILVGFSNTGKSTFAELINKYSFGNDSQLAFEKDKYVRQGVISTKSIRIQTVVPQLYTSKNGQGVSILDSPCFVLTTQNSKKWTLTDQKVTANLMISNIKKAGFLFFIEQKNTRSNVNPWKKVFYGWMDVFKQLSDEHINSMGWIITKCPPDIAQDSVAKRLKVLQAALKDDKLADPNLIDKIFDSILKNNRFYISRKGTGNQQAESEQIQKIFKQLTVLPHYQVQREHLNQKMSLSLQEQPSIKQYLQKGDEVLLQLLGSIEQMIHLKNHDFENCEAIKKKHEISLVSELVISDKIVKKLNKDQDCQIWEIVKAFSQTKQGVQKYTNEQASLTEVLDSLFDFPFFFFKHSSDEQSLEFVQNAVSFNQTANLDYKFSKSSAKLKQIFVSKCNSFYKLLEKWGDNNDTEEFHENVINLLQQDKKLSGEVQKILDKSKEAILKFRNSKKLLSKMCQQLQSKDTRIQVQAATRIGVTFQKEQYYREACQVFKMVGCPGDYFRCFEKTKVDNENSAQEHISYLAQICLFDTAKRCCYEYASQFGPKSRNTFGQCLKKVIAEQKKFFKETQVENCLLKELKLAESRIKDLLHTTKQVMAQLKDS